MLLKPKASPPSSVNELRLEIMVSFIDGNHYPPPPIASFLKLTMLFKFLITLEKRRDRGEGILIFFQNVVLLVEI